ncbi:hypothetical protein GEMRC1_009946 [Eukaryota sp. GEM-RC1]
MCHSGPSLSINDVLSPTGTNVCVVSSTSISSLDQPHCNDRSALPSPLNPSSEFIWFQQSLVVLLHFHLLMRFLKSPLEAGHIRPRRVLLKLKTDIPKFFMIVGYVSHRFFESALLTTKVFFQTNTFHVVPKDLPQLCLFASFFGAEIDSVFLHVRGNFHAPEFLCYSHLTSGLEMELRHHIDLEFLNKSSLFFPRLKQLDVCVSSSISMAMIELLKVNSTVTSIDLVQNSLGDDGARALAEALKVNTTVTSVNLMDNSIGDEGARALAEALKVNTTVTSVNLTCNSIEAEGARALADMLKVNTTIVSVDMCRNSIGVEGSRALSEALKVNSTITSVDLNFNSIGDEGARALADALKVNTTVTSIYLKNNSFGDEGSEALSEALKVNSTITIEGLGQFE